MLPVNKFDLIQRYLVSFSILNKVKSKILVLFELDQPPKYWTDY